MDSRTESITCKSDLPFNPVAGWEAVITNDPVERAVTAPFWPAALSTDAMAEFELDHVTRDEISPVLPSVYVPMAVTLLFRPNGSLDSADFTAMCFNVAVLTVIPALPDAPVAGSIAVTTVSPSAAPFTCPRNSGSVWAMAIRLFAVVQFSILVTSLVEPSVKDPLAVS